ncbi:polysaccharide deacetylase [Sulfitobacter sp. SK012]|uniref:polysaccharide deacetylase family protein n=1 Tax=Sulfitobacter sp. SK012 TaxID=1389005 RepID=UPI000E0C758A|nr:polysaccharide deacetylase family protein [Sulfitobacter sp. SK012]AXI48043.1 polysaccharide deacetylase [Sulfitobacter sp. SK012]
MKANWGPVEAELAKMRHDGLALPIWWRDDDAVTTTRAFRRLIRLSEKLNVPVHVAVIPKLADTRLSEKIADSATVVPLVHGWEHVKHFAGSQKLAEFGLLRPETEQELVDGLARMKILFGPKLVPIFVPPWNRIDDRVIPQLADNGYVGLSTYLPRKSRFAAPGLTQINTHVDPIFWRGHRGLVPQDELISLLAKLLADRREGKTDAAEPLGILTHHLVHNRKIWTFTHDCLRVLLDGGAVACDLSKMKDNLP